MNKLQENVFCLNTTEVAEEKTWHGRLFACRRELLFGACVLVVVTLTLGIGLGGKCKLGHVVYGNSSTNQLYFEIFYEPYPVIQLWISR